MFTRDKHAYILNEHLQHIHTCLILLTTSVYAVKLTSMQLVGESMAAISVPLEAILKLENVDYCGEKAVRKCWFTYMKMDFFRLRNKG